MIPPTHLIISNNNIYIYIYIYIYGGEETKDVEGGASDAFVCVSECMTKDVEGGGSQGGARERVKERESGGSRESRKRERDSQGAAFSREGERGRERDQGCRRRE